MAPPSQTARAKPVFSGCVAQSTPIIVVRGITTSSVLVDSYLDSYPFMHWEKRRAHPMTASNHPAHLLLCLLQTTSGTSFPRFPKET
jgi:hypothetical protein